MRWFALYVLLYVELGCLCFLAGAIPEDEGQSAAPETPKADATTPCSAGQHSPGFRRPLQAKPRILSGRGLRRGYGKISANPARQSRGARRMHRSAPHLGSHNPSRRSTPYPGRVATQEVRRSSRPPARQHRERQGSGNLRAAWGRQESLKLWPRRQNFLEPSAVKGLHGSGARHIFPHFFLRQTLP